MFELLSTLTTQLDLTLIVEPKYVILTTARRAAWHRTTRLYDVRHLDDLNLPSRFDSQPSGEYTALLASVVECLPKETSNGPPQRNSVRIVAGALVVRQTDGVHREVEALLDSLTSRMTSPDAEMHRSADEPPKCAQPAIGDDF